MGILLNDCGIDKESFGNELETFLQNPEKLSEPRFNYHPESEKKSTPYLRANDSFNKDVVKLLNKDEGKLWKEIDKSLRAAAYKKDFNRIVEKFGSSKSLESEIAPYLKAIYSGGKIEAPFDQLKIILIFERLKKKGIDANDAKTLATEFVKKTQNLESLKEDSRLKKIKDNEKYGKIEAIFTKYVAFGKISDASQLRKRIVGKILYQFQKKFAREIHDLDGIQTIEMEGNEILFRGLNAESGLTEDLVRQQFEDLYLGETILHGVSQNLGSYRIMHERVQGDLPLTGIENKASYAKYSSANFAVAAEYAQKGNEDGKFGWILDIRPQKGRLAVNLNEDVQKYSEIDFEALNPEEIYAVYKVSAVKGDEVSGTIVAKNRIEKVIKNPHYKKRKEERFDLISEGQEIATSKNIWGIYWVNENDEKSIQLQLRPQILKFELGTHLRNYDVKNSSEAGQSQDENDEKYKIDNNQYKAEFEIEEPSLSKAGASLDKVLEEPTNNIEVLEIKKIQLTNNIAQKTSQL